MAQIAYKVDQSNQVTACKECGKEFVIGVKDCCSERCFKKNIKERSIKTTKEDKSHTASFQKQNRCYSNLEIS